MWKSLTLVLLSIATTHTLDSQVPCPVSLISAHAEQDDIRLEFMNRGKVPIERLSLACAPSADNKSRDAICHSETGIFYPGTGYWLEVPYTGATHHSTVISVKEVRLAGGVAWDTRSSKCRPLRVSARK